MQNYKIIQADKLADIDGTEALILDVRTLMEHNEKHIGLPHDHVELDLLDPKDFMLRRGLTKDDHIYILCGSGNRARRAAEKFVEAGYGNIHVVEGGLGACETAGHPIKGYGAGGAKSVSAGTPVSLERQVRIVAGAMVFAGAVLGMTVNPLFTLLSLFVGAGLVFAGVTNRCGMALLLTKAPWNKNAARQENAAPACNLGNGGSSSKGGTCAGGTATEAKPKGQSCE